MDGTLQLPVRRLPLSHQQQSAIKGHQTGGTQLNISLIIMVWHASFSALVIRLKWTWTEPKSGRKSQLNSSGAPGVHGLPQLYPEAPILINKRKDWSVIDAGLWTTIFCVYYITEALCSEAGAENWDDLARFIQAVSGLGWHRITRQTIDIRESGRLVVPVPALSFATRDSNLLAIQVAVVGRSYLRRILFTATEGDLGSNGTGERHQEDKKCSVEHHDSSVLHRTTRDQRTITPSHGCEIEHFRL
jgi:hypothetical protein